MGILLDDTKYVGATGKIYVTLNRWIGSSVSRFPLSANAVTLLSFGCWLVGCYWVYEGRWLSASCAILVSSVGDGFDGAVARAKGQESTQGTFLDFYTDRIADEEQDNPSKSSHRSSTNRLTCGNRVVQSICNQPQDPTRQ